MFRYETLFLTVPEITKDEAILIEKQFDELVNLAHGKILSFERWGKYRLAYPIANNDYGVYFLARFEIDSDQANKFLNDLRLFLSIKHGSLAKRNMTTVLPLSKPLAYQRPESLEETPQDVDDFLRKNKMGGLIHKGSRREKSQEEVSKESFDQKSYTQTNEPVDENN